MSIKPYVSYTDRNTENSVSRLKVESKNKAIIKKLLTLPTIVSLGTYSKSFGDANFFSPYIKNDTDSDNTHLYIDRASASLNIIASNLSFIEELNMINNYENYFNKSLRKHIKAYIYGVDNKIGKFADDYDSFKNQILNVLKDNIAFIVPNKDTLVYKAVAKSCSEDFLDNSKSVYDSLDKKQKMQCERLFLKVANLYTKIFKNEKNLDTLYNDIKKLHEFTHNI